MQRRRLWVSRLLNDLYQDQENRVAPIILSWACGKMYRSHRIQKERPERDFPEFILPHFPTPVNKSLENDLKPLFNMELPKRLLYPLIGFLDEDTLLTPLHEPSTTDFFVRLLENMNPLPTNALFHIVKKKIRSQNFEEAETLFINFLQRKEMTLEKANSAELNEHEQEVLYFFQSRLIDSKYLKSVLINYLNLIAQHQNSNGEQLHISRRIKVFSLIGFIEGMLKTGEFGSDLYHAIWLLTEHENSITLKQRELFISMQKMLPLRQIKAGPLDVEKTKAIFEQYPFALPYIVAAISKSSHKEEYLPNLCELLSLSIKQEQTIPLDEALIVLANSESAWSLHCLTKLYENSTNRITPIIFSLVLAVLRFKYQSLRHGSVNSEPLKSNEQFALNLLPQLINHLQQSALSQRWLRYLLEFILENECIDPLEGESLADKFTPILAKIDPQPIELILLLAKQAHRLKKS